MESANLHQLQDQLLGSSSLANYPSCYGVGSTHAWTPNTILNSGNFNPNMNGVIINSRDPRPQQNDILVPSLNSSMIQDLGFHWPNKEELSDSYPKFTEMINSATRIEDFHMQPTISYVKNEQKGLDDLSEKLLLRTFYSGCQINGGPGGREYYSNAQNCGRSRNTLGSRGNFSQIFPTINISNLNRSSSAISSPLDTNMQLFTNLSQPSHGLFKESLSYGFDHMQQSTHRPSNSPTKISPFTNGVTEAKRTSSILEPKPPQAAAKKSRLESRASCPPFKVRKEKLGDRIAALQQLVAPFGKTDTASVLMEAIGYIKFLQNQVETLNVPYMKSSRNKIISRTTQEGSKEDGKEEGRRDLRSRGLCLVPLSCLSYVTADGGGVWPSPNFCGGT
uniref:BHLH domain-containing protein n=1 Tax=Davidia involucrata TaxID=16924 RepID=A0A5B6YJR3_DAVIN